MIVRVEPSGSFIDVRDGEALMAGAFRSGYRWVSICCGLVESGACVVEIIGANAEHLHAANDKERDRLSTAPERCLRPDAVLRLACQFRPGTTDATVVKRGVRVAS